MTNYAYVLTKKYPNSIWELSDNDYENIIWKSDDTKPTKKELDDLVPIIKSEEKKDEQDLIKKRQTILDRLGITNDEFNALIG